MGKTERQKTRPVKCGRCKGSGVLDIFDGGGTCPICKGVGKVRI